MGIALSYSIYGSKSIHGEHGIHAGLGEIIAEWNSTATIGVQRHFMSAEWMVRLRIPQLRWVRRARRRRL